MTWQRYNKNLRKSALLAEYGGANHKQTEEEKALGVSNEELVARRLGDHRREPIVVTDVPAEVIEELKANKEENA